jgi:hypothetical protein
MCSARSFSFVKSSTESSRVSWKSLPRRRVPAMGRVSATVPRRRTSRSGEELTSVQSPNSQDLVEAKRVVVPDARREPLGQVRLVDVTGGDVLLASLHHGFKALTGQQWLETDRSSSPARVARPHTGGRRRKLSGNIVQPLHRLVVQPSPLVLLRLPEAHLLLPGAGVHDHPRLVRKMVEGHHQVHEKKAGIGDREIVPGGPRKILELVDEIVGEQADRPAGERRQPVDARRPVVRHKLTELRERLAFQSCALAVFPFRSRHPVELYRISFRPKDEVGVCSDKRVPAGPLVHPGALEKHGMAERPEGMQSRKRRDLRCVQLGVQRENAAPLCAPKELFTYWSDVHGK